MAQPAPPILIGAALAYAKATGFQGDPLVTIVAIAMAESSLVPNARLVNTDGSVDRGILQINSTWHAEVSDACADAPACAFQQGYRISSNGTDFSPWSTYKSGAYKRFLAQVQQAQSPRPHLSRPFSGNPTITQSFGPTDVQSEPAGYLWPDGTVSYYHAGGQRHDHLHSGVDYALADKTPLYAPAAGVVFSAELDTTGYGLALKIDHGPVTSLCAHLTDIVVKPGQKVEAGQLVAHSGGDSAHEPNSGNSSGPHLHFSTIDTTLTPARYRNPAEYILIPATPDPRPTAFVKTAFSVTAQKDKFPVHLFSGPSQGCSVVGALSSGQKVECTGYFYMPDEAVFDHQAKIDDHRFYQVQMTPTTYAFVASARVDGNANGSHP